MEKEKNILVLYLEETVLSSGLQLLLGNIQAIHKSFFYNESDFEKVLCESLSNNTLYQNTTVFSFAEDNQYFGSIPSKNAFNRFLDNYLLLGLIGKGGLAKVYRAESIRTGVQAAVKCSRIDSSYRGSVAKACFDSEKTIIVQLMKIMCPFIPTIYDWFEDEEQVYIVESFVDGESLDSRQPLSEDEVVDIAKKVLKILLYLHDNHIVYRDIKPGNLIRDKYGEIHLIDFNTAMTIENGGSKAEICVGTRGFSLPEQYDVNGVISYASDIYALGQTMIYLLCPEYFDRNASIPLRYYRADVSVQLESVIRKMTAPSQADRFQNAGELLRCLETYKKISLWERIRLLIRSRREIKLFEDKRKATAETQRKFLREMANATTRFSGEDINNTVILTESTDDTVW